MSTGPKPQLTRTIGSTIAAHASELDAEVVRSLCQVGVFVPQGLLDLTQDLTAAYMLSLLIFKSGLHETKKRGGWSWEKRKEMEEKFYVARRGQQNARKLLRGLGLLEERQGGRENLLYFRVNFPVLIESLRRSVQNEQAGVSVESELAGAVQTGWMDGPVPAGRSKTSKPSSESSPESPAEASGRSDPAKIHRGAASQCRADGARLTDLIQKLARQKTPPSLDVPGDPLTAEMFKGIYRKKLENVIFDTRRLRFGEQLAACVKEAVTMLENRRVAKLKALAAGELENAVLSVAKDRCSTIALVNNFDSRAAELSRAVHNLVARTAAELLRKRTPTLFDNETV